MATKASATGVLVTPLYHPPILPSSIQHVALSSKSFRVFGLDDPAWKNARKDWKEQNSSSSSGGDGGNDDGGGKNKASLKKSALRGGGALKKQKSTTTTTSSSSAPPPQNMHNAFTSKSSSLKNGLGLNCGDDDDDSDYTSSSDDDEEEDDDDEEDIIIEAEGGNNNIEEQEEMAIVCKAITTALAEDAGGFGTAGFHVSKVDHVQLLTNLNEDKTSSSAVYTAKLIPHDAELKEPLDPSSVLNIMDDTGEVRYIGNDKFYLTHNLEEQQSAKNKNINNNAPPFQIRITISKAREGVAAKKYHEALFYKRKQISDQLLGASDEILEFDVDQWVQEDEELKVLQQNLIDARDFQENNNNSNNNIINNGTTTTTTTNNNKGESNQMALGYYVEIMLIEPHVRGDEIVIAPPVGIDKSHPCAKPSKGINNKYPTRLEEAQSGIMQKGGNGGSTNSNGIFRDDIFASRQFAAAGPWERANIKAYGDMGLDVRKALVRVEFPVFPEGCKDKTFREVYQLNARLKSGSFATVCRGTHRATAKKIAVKCVLRKDLPPSDDAAIYDEVLILSTLRHPYICPLIDFFEERECYFFVMELMSGGDLFDRIGKRKSYTENDCRDLCRKMLESLRYCHENSVAHCDMKPKNLLLISDDDDVQMKLADFGFATRVYEPNSLTKQCGTPFFVAPEVLMRSPYDQQSDMWSCGVIMFLLLAGDLPFMGRSQKELFRNIVMGKYEFEEAGWSQISEEAKELVKQLLVTDPSKRLTSREAMASPWMRQRGNMLMKNNLQYTSQRLRGFNARMKLRASMIAVSSVVSLRMSVRSLTSSRSLASSKKLSASTGSSRQPSFLNLPDESVDNEERDDEDDDSDDDDDDDDDKQDC